MFIINGVHIRIRAWSKARVEWATYFKSQILALSFSCMKVLEEDEVEMQCWASILESDHRFYGVQSGSRPVVVIKSTTKGRRSHSLQKYWLSVSNMSSRNSAEIIHGGLLNWNTVQSFLGTKFDADLIASAKEQVRFLGLVQKTPALRRPEVLKCAIHRYVFASTQSGKISSILREFARITRYFWIKVDTSAIGNGRDRIKQQ